LNRINPPHPHSPSKKPSPVNKAGLKYVGIIATLCKLQRSQVERWYPSGQRRDWRAKKKAAQRRLSRFNCASIYAVASIAPLRRQRIRNPTPPKPMIIIPQVASSGTPATSSVSLS